MFSAKIVVFLAALAVCYGAPNHAKKFSSKSLGIDGGSNVEVQQFPYIASVQQGDMFGPGHVCGGVIINEQYVLTAANCASVADNVVVGFDDPESRRAVHADVQARFIHPNASVSELGPNDIGLLKLKQSLTFNDTIKAAQLPTQGQEFNGSAVVIGYGGNRFEETTKKLHAVFNITLVSHDDCNKAIADVIPDVDSPLDSESNLCTLDNASNICIGDIGSPLIQNGTVIGIGTWFINPCGGIGAPNIFTKLSTFADWINQTIANN